MKNLKYFENRDKFIQNEFSLENDTVSFVEESNSVELVKDFLKLEFTISEDEIGTQIPIYSYNSFGGYESSLDNIKYLIIDGKYIDITSLESIDYDGNGYAVEKQLTYIFEKSGVHSIWYMLDLYEYVDANYNFVGYYLNNASFAYIHHITKIVEFPEKITEIGWLCFCETSITELILPKTIKYIGNFSFAGCTKLENIELNDGLIQLLEEAFSSCNKLTQITIPKTVSYLDRWVFQYCFNLTSIKFLSETPPEYHVNLAYGVGFDGIVFYPNGSNYSDILEYFSGWKWTSIQFNSEYTYNIRILSGGTYLNDVNLKIGDNIFTFNESENCYQSNITLTEDSQMIDTIYINNEEIGTFNYGRTTYTLLIGDNSSSNNIISCKYNTSNIKNDYGLYFGTAFTFDSMSINGKPNGDLKELTKENEEIIVEYFRNSEFTKIDNSAFSHGIIEKINIPNTVISIDRNAFYGCELLSEIIIPDSVTSIGSYVFTSGFSLTNITIPSSVTSIGEYAFWKCSSLNEITCLAEVAPTITHGTFNGVSSNGILKYPSGSDYSSWLNTNADYLGYYNWASEEIEI